MEVFDREDLGEQAGQEELELFAVLIGGGEDKEGLLFDGDLDVVGVGCLQVVDLGLPEDEGAGLDCSFLEGDPSRHVLDVLHDEVHRNPVVSEARDDDVGVDDGRQDEGSEGILDKLVVLFQDADDRTSAFLRVSFETAAEADVVWVGTGLPSQLMKIL